MRIMHLLASNKFSGAENVVCQIINMFRDETDIEMIYCSPDGDIRSALTERAVNFVPVKEIKNVIKKQKPDLIHAHDMRASFIAAQTSGKIPFVSHIHGNFAGLNKATPKAIAYAYAASKAKHVFWVSKSSFDNYVFKGIAKKKSSVLYNVIDVEALNEKAFSDSNTYNYDVVFLGRLTWEKDPERLIRVIDLVVKKRPQTRIAIVGTGDMEEQTKSLATALSLNNNIDFLGFRSNPLKILHDSKVMLMTSIREGTPMCALEAMALGVPIVSTPTDGMKDLVEDGKTGYLSDDDCLLCKNIFGIISNYDLREKMSLNSTKNFNFFNDLRKYKKILREAYGL